MQIKVRIQQRGNKTLNFFQKENKAAAEAAARRAGLTLTLKAAARSEAGCWWDARDALCRSSELRRWPLIVGAIGQMIVPQNKRGLDEISEISALL